MFRSFLEKSALSERIKSVLYSKTAAKDPRIHKQENFHGVLNYLVEWRPTLEPEDSLGHAKELVNGFEQLRARHRVKMEREPGFEGHRAQ